MSQDLLLITWQYLANTLKINDKLEINMHHLGGDAIPAGPIKLF